MQKRLAGVRAVSKKYASNVAQFFKQQFDASGPPNIWIMANNRKELWFKIEVSST